MVLNQSSSPLALAGFWPMRVLSVLSLGTALFGSRSAAAAESAAAEASGSASLGGGAGQATSESRWIDRWPAEAGLGELSIYGGLFLLNNKHELFQPQADAPSQGFRELQRFSPSFGVRLGYYPRRMFGLEAEGGAMPSSTDDDDAHSAIIWAARLHAVLQFGRKSIVPFIFAGPGVLGVASDPDAVGNDVDPALDFGAGLKFNLSRRAQIRVDVRDVLTHGRGVSEALNAHNLEATLSLGLVLGRRPAPAPLPSEPEPQPPSDRDGDGFLDDEDDCPDEPETINTFEDEDGCPESDRDGDGFWDRPEQDQCPDEAGVAPDGCPIPDTDGDGVLDPDDDCVDEPETVNGFQDKDGCPDEVPKEVEKFTGVIKGIYFENNKDTITPNSETVLRQALDVLRRFDSVRVEISGHTDARGSHEHNLDLSQRRAESVRNFLVDHGIDASRIETVGHGPDQPIDTNDTSRGRAKNRRIEFRLLK
ncbi:MAG: OmpA family protein [Myxococcales bacterium FL481]|nr:MAG: OmpA family protein [Myxococcales bacterium FL481]